MEAVRVPPSASRTSQSIVTVRSPSASKSTTARNDRPTSRWISCVRPPTFPVRPSRATRVFVARGSIEYSAVTHPFPAPRRNGGTRSSTVAAHTTRVLPHREQDGPFGMLLHPEGDVDRPDVQRLAPVGALERHRSSCPGALYLVQHLPHASGEGGRAVRLREEPDPRQEDVTTRYKRIFRQEGKLHIDSCEMPENERLPPLRRP